MDYDPTVLSNLILTSNMTQLTIRIPIVNDNIAEATEHFTGKLVSNDVLIVLSTTRIDILDDDIDHMLAVYAYSFNATTNHALDCSTRIAAIHTFSCLLPNLVK